MVMAQWNYLDVAYGISITTLFGLESVLTFATTGAFAWMPSKLVGVQSSIFYRKFHWRRNSSPLWIFHVAGYAKPVLCRFLFRMHWVLQIDYKEFNWRCKDYLVSKKAFILRKETGHSMPSDRSKGNVLLWAVNWFCT